MKQKRKSTHLHDNVLQLSRQIVKENPFLIDIFKHANHLSDAKHRLRMWLKSYFNSHRQAMEVFRDETVNWEHQLSWNDRAAIRLLDYLNHEGLEFRDPNLSNARIVNHPIENLWRIIRFEKGNCSEDFCLDMLYLFRQLNGKLKQSVPSKKRVMRWMQMYSSGLDTEIIEQRKQNKDRIIRQIIQNIDSGRQRSQRFQFIPNSSFEEKYQQVNQWWNNYRFHLSFAIRNPKLLNEMLGNSLSEKIMKRLQAAHEKGIPLFVNPHYLSLLCISPNCPHPAVNRVIHDYVFPSQKLIDEFGNIEAWEKEDKVLAGEPNTAGWILPPFHNIHRRYPETAIFIPDTTGRACGGLCVSCQRMYDFQSGHFNFDLQKLKAPMRWSEKMKLLLTYFEEDTQLRDILITGGDALMSSNTALKQILEAVYQMALRKKEANKNRKQGEKYAEIVRVRLGTRLPIYIPQRIDDELILILKAFREKAEKIGIRQFIIQTHIETAMEITPETKQAVERFLKAGWLVTNQQVFTTAASVRGHTAKLRQVLNNIGVVPYYTFSVKGFMENHHNFATNARSVQEKTEEKRLGEIPNKYNEELASLHNHPQKAKKHLDKVRKKIKSPFLATDRNIMNLPGVGKSMSFRTIGITTDGRRILKFKYDPTRKHSPIINQKGDVIIIESKSIAKYLRQLKNMGEKIKEYKSIWGYSISETEPRSSIFEYPEYDYSSTEAFTNLQLKPIEWQEVVKWNQN